MGPVRTHGTSEDTWGPEKDRFETVCGKITFDDVTNYLKVCRIQQCSAQSTTYDRG